MWSGTPAFAANETNVCLSEWKVASGVLRRRPSRRMLVVILALANILDSSWLTRQLERFEPGHGHVEGAFLRDEIKFLDIYDIIEETMLKRECIVEPTLEELFEEDRWAREFATEVLRKL